MERNIDKVRHDKLYTKMNGRFTEDGASIVYGPTPEIDDTFILDEILLTCEHLTNQPIETLSDYGQGKRAFATLILDMADRMTRQKSGYVVPVPRVY